MSAATSAFARFDHAFWLRVCVVGRIGWTLMGGARSSSFIHRLALQLFAIGFALFGRLCWSDFDAGAIFSAGAFCCVTGAPAFSFVFVSCAQATPAPSSNIAAVVDNSCKFLIDSLLRRAKTFWAASMLLVLMYLATTLASRDRST